MSEMDWCTQTSQPSKTLATDDKSKVRAVKTSTVKTIVTSNYHKLEVKELQSTT